MPRRTLSEHSVKSICVNSVLLFTFLALLGHSIIHFWRRHSVYAELYSMKSNLDTLQETISYIKNAYDNLHVDILDVMKVAEQKQIIHTLKRTPADKEVDVYQCKQKCHTNRVTPTVQDNIHTRKTYRDLDPDNLNDAFAKNPFKLAGVNK